MFPKSIARQTHILFAIIITIPMVIFALMTASHTKELLRFEQERNLFMIAASISQRIPASFLDSLAQQEGETPSLEERRHRFHLALQPIIADIAAEWPQHAIGIYLPTEKVIAVMPMRQELIGREATPEALRIYDSKRYQIDYIDNGFTQGGKPILALNYPFFHRDGEIAGHIFANIKAEDIEHAYYNTLIVHLTVIVSIWLGVAATLWWMFRRLRQALTGLAEHLLTGNDDPAQFTEFPELKSMLQTIRTLREQLCEEYRTKEIYQTELTKLDRLNLVGQMAAGVAHEIRNPMTVVMGYIQMMALKADGKAQEQCSIIIGELKRVNEIISDFLSLARNKAIEKRSLDVNEVIDHLTPLLEAECVKNSVRLVKELYHPLPAVLADSKELTQLLLNLARNAIEAMPRGGSLLLGTWTIDGTVQLSVADTGCGIPEKQVEAIFDPFYTTKDDGTGLGLSICKSIVERHGGKLAVQTREGVGTIFTVVLPTFANDLLYD